MDNPGRDTARVSSCFPKAMLLLLDRFSCQYSGLLKSSWNSISPILGRRSIVGVMTGVGKGVKVAVGGNQIMVGDGVLLAGGIDCSINTGSRGGSIGAAQQAPKNHTTSGSTSKKNFFCNLS